MPRPVATLLVGLLLVPALTASAQNWPDWRGPNHDGTAEATGLPTDWTKEGKNVLWRTPLPGRAGATPCVWGDHIFLTSNDGDDLVVLGLSTKDGRILWKKQVGSGNQDARAGEGNSASPSPSTDGKHVWSFFGTGILACHTIDGDEVWKIDINERFGRIDIQFGMTSTPVLDGGALYLQLIHGPMKLDDQTRTGKVVKLDAATGQMIWEVERPTDAQFECKHAYASPAVYRDGAREFLVVHGADCITGHALGDGAARRGAGEPRGLDVERRRDRIRGARRAVREGRARIDAAARGRCTDLDRTGAGAAARGQGEGAGAEGGGVAPDRRPDA